MVATEITHNRPLAEHELQEINQRFAGAADESEALIRWAVETYRPRLAISCSFGGPSGMVLLDLALGIDAGLSVVYVDTDYLFPETYATIRAVEQRYGITALAFRSTLPVQTQEQLFGPALWERDADACCAVRKVEPMRVALSQFSAYLTGLRRDQAETRRETPLVQWDAKFGLLKLNPLASWGEARIWSYIMEHHLPYNPLHDQNYPSLGCTNCTRAVQPGEDPRAGRWSGSDKVECGLHTPA